MKILAVSTGGAHIYAQTHAAAFAMRRMRFDQIIGGSAGAWIAIVAAVHGVDRMIEIINGFDLKSAYRFIPFKPDGSIKLRAIARFAMGKSLAIQDDLHLFDKIIPKCSFDRYKLQKDAPRAYAVTVELNQNKTHLWDLKDLSYEQARYAVICSGRMQGIAKGLYNTFEGRAGYHVDAGARDHVQSHHLLGDQVDTLTSIYSWPENWQIPSVRIDPKKGSIAELFRVIGVANYETAQNDMEKERQMCEDHQITRYQIFMDRLRHSFDIDPYYQQKTIKSALSSCEDVLGHLKPIKTWQ